MHTGGNRPLRKEPRRSSASRSKSMARVASSWKRAVSWCGKRTTPCHGDECRLHGVCIESEGDRASLCTQRVASTTAKSQRQSKSDEVEALTCITRWEQDQGKK